MILTVALTRDSGETITTVVDLTGIEGMQDGDVLAERVVAYIPILADNGHEFTDDVVRVNIPRVGEPADEVGIEG